MSTFPAAALGAATAASTLADSSDADKSYRLTNRDTPLHDALALEHGFLLRYRDEPAAGNAPMARSAA